MGSFSPSVVCTNPQAQEVVCEDLMEIEIYGPPMDGSEAMIASLGETIADLLADADGSEALITSLEETIASLRAQVAGFEGYLSEVDVDQLLIDTMVDEIAFDDYIAATLPQDVSLTHLTNRGRSKKYDTAGFPIINEYSPEASFYLRNAQHDSLLRDMQGEVFQFPESGNLPEDVIFDLPDPPAYSVPSDLYYMPILELASLLRSGAVTCTTLVQAFIDRLDEFDPFLAIVVTPLYERALAMAEGHQALLDGGTDLGPLMCIPFGVKDHHQVFDDDPTTYGNILYSNNIQKTKSVLMEKMMGYGAIPIAKTVLGTFASGSVHGWGDCMSPYLNGEGGGSSCGSGSGAALGAFPFAVSEETYGSVASPSHASLISGHISSYGTISRTGAGLLATEMDHLGFHTRYLSDFGVVFNYMRTGPDDGDGDAVAIPYENPSNVDVTALKVLIIVGEGSWEQDEEGEWEWEGGIDNGRGKNGWKWPLRSQRIIERLEAAGVPYDAVTREEAEALWSFNETTSPYYTCGEPDTLSLMSHGPWAQTQEFTFGFINSGWGRLPNLPAKAHRYMTHCMVEMGKLYLNDPIWSEYSVMIDTNWNVGGGRPLGGGFEMWVRTAKTFVVDYMEALPCMHTSGGTVEAGLSTLTALPFNDAYNFAIGQIIQDPANLVFPNDEAIKVAFADRERCPFTFFEGFNNIDETCPAINTVGAPPYPDAEKDTMSNRCVGSRQHLPDDWGKSLYVPPYDLADMAPDEGINRWEDYGPVACTHICPFLQSFCDMKSIVCDERRLVEEAKFLKDNSVNRRLREFESEIWETRQTQMEIDMLKHADT
jgi:hypothetical protein